MPIYPPEHLLEAVLETQAALAQLNATPLLDRIELLNLLR
jgi:hypothetical protein